VTNHDLNGSDGTPLDLFDGKKGSMAAFVVIAYMKSIPMIYNGQEVATPYRLTFPFTGKKIDWSINPDVTAEYKKVIGFRNQSNAVRRGTLVSYTTDNVCAFTKTDGKEVVFVISNLRNKRVDFTIPTALANTGWKNAFSNVKQQVRKSISLEPYTYLVLRK
jgi:glycosidase